MKAGYFQINRIHLGSSIFSLLGYFWLRVVFYIITWIKVKIPPPSFWFPNLLYHLILHHPSPSNQFYTPLSYISPFPSLSPNLPILCPSIPPPPTHDRSFPSPTFPSPSTPCIPSPVYFSSSSGQSTLIFLLLFQPFHVLIQILDPLLESGLH